ncbi:PTS sugar transporter subunit IIA [Alkalibacterium pelagium]|uniref:PTS system, fructose-specific IIA component n=1 Tax=Alkalibacterium pelagium TaxID=426702 RepID=A0A1H7I5W9_9LACT|nr:PTS sugar transporter subunit IIA [Alkalibacterium pelagium]GEN49976.1 PTS mannitol transporter subunit IIC [Alkalibacterium pelagium]SEK57818.1 PTS system, fructose-specific IIA component [Alkalibacterium pelagium]
MTNNDRPVIHAAVEVKSDADGKDRLLKEIVQLVHTACSFSFDENEVYQEVMTREELSTTGFGNGFAIPHGKSSDLEKPIVSVCKLARKMEWEALDDEKVDTVILLIIPKDNAEDLHLKLLSALSYNLMDQNMQEKIREADKEDELSDVIESMLHIQ